MITYEITEASILTILSKNTQKVTMHELFEQIPPAGQAQENAITFIKTLNQLLEMEFVETSQTTDGLVQWNITETGGQYLNDYLNS